MCNNEYIIINMIVVVVVVSQAVYGHHAWDADVFFFIERERERACVGHPCYHAW